MGSYERLHPNPNGPPVVWAAVRPGRWATSDNCLAWFQHLLDIRVRSRQQPYALRERERWTRDHDERFEKRLRRLHAGTGCHAAVRWYNADLWLPCPFGRYAALRSEFCWRHGGWNTMPKTRSEINLDEDCDDEKPSAEVSVTLGDVTLGTLTRKLGALQRAARGMGAPDDATVTVNTYSGKMTALIRWRP